MKKVLYDISVTLTVIPEKLDNKNSLNKIGGKDYLIELATSTPSAANLEAYSEIIRQRSITRKLMKANSEISELISNPAHAQPGPLFRSCI